MLDTSQTYALITAGRFNLAYNLAVSLKNHGIVSILVDTLPHPRLLVPDPQRYVTISPEQIPQIAEYISYFYNLDAALLHTFPSQDSPQICSAIDQIAQDCAHFAYFYDWNTTIVYSTNMPEYSAPFTYFHKSNSRMVMLHEHLSQDELILGQNKTPLSICLSKYLQKKLLRLSKNYPLSPLSTADAINAIIRASFSPNTKGHHFFCAQKNPLDLYTLLAQLEQYPHLSIGNATKKPCDPSQVLTRDQIIATQNTLNWHPEPSLAVIKKFMQLSINVPVGKSKKAIQTNQKALDYPRIVRSIVILRKIVTSHSLTHTIPRITKTSTRYLSYVTLLLLLCVGIYGFFVGRSAYSLYQSIQFLQQGKFSQAKIHAQYAASQFPHFRSQIASLPMSLSQTSSIQLLDANYKLALDTSKIILTVSDTATAAKQVLVNLNMPDTDSSQSLQELNRLTPKLQQELTLYNASLPQNVPFPINHVVSQNQFDQKKQLLSSVNSYLSDYAKIRDSLPQVLGFTDPQTYVLLFQNNYELRPTGGFIGSFATLTLNHGSISALDVHDVYDADGQLRGFVPAPEAIQKYLGETAWYVRDANWDPDFPTSVQDIRWFLDKEINLNAQGFFAVNLSAVQSILGVLGPVRIDNLDQPLTQDNVHELLQSHIETGFFAGSQRKRSSLSQLTNAMIDQTKNLPATKFPTLLSTISQNLAQKQMLLYFDQPQLQQLASHYHWTGQVSPVLGVSNDVISDTFFLVDANVGVNKANQFVTLTNHHQVRLEADATYITTTRTYHNASTQENKQQGTYKDYLRIYLPPDAQLESIQIQTKTMQEDVVPENQGSHHGYQVIGFPLTVPPQEDVKLQYTYALPQVLPDNIDDAAYQIQLIKQPGTSPDPFTIDVQIPSHLTPQVIITESQTQSPTLTPGGDLTYNTDLATDRFIRINFKQ